MKIINLSYTVSAIFFILVELILRIGGYTMLTLFTQPFSFYLFIIPIIIIFYIYFTILFVSYKPLNIKESYLKWMSLIFFNFLTLCNICHPWIYSVVGYNLQNTIIAFIIISSVSLLSFNLYIKLKTEKLANYK